ncbi:MAG TPA: molybdopterin-dependent oxidoreductase [Ideonella sp.]|uniref:molybdopterin-dependent oxidoreductase n=1 Tax=Ideonella sp. TaxID=1929293 RepID=UPI002E32715B|nr:molybdopterin-dependent oxidoreductase [Ideonella sp.]HEX5684512.1 molybdopterin-dependent oxidoreductase [Ideonella sp.]
MSAPPPLPPGQRETEDFPRFGLTPFAVRFPTTVDAISLQVSGDVQTPLDAGPALASLSRVEQQSDFHCVTTWTRRGLPWGGVRFADFYREVVVPLAGAAPEASFVVLRGQDGARTSLPLEDLLAPDVLLADRLFGQPLSIEHGAPLRLVAPAHYGYKSVKHLNRVEFWRSGANYRPFGLRFMVHPRARVAHEERGQWVPGWLLRHLYRPLIRPTVARFEQAMRQRLQSSGAGEPGERS